MKKFLIIAGIAFIISCANNGDGDADTSKSAEPVSANVDDPVVTKGLELIGKSDCLTCHKILDASTGPAYQAVADKYEPTEAIIDTLASRIIKGSVGHWGTVVMTPHPDLSMEDARTMVKYVFSHKK